MENPPLAKDPRLQGGLPRETLYRLNASFYRNMVEKEGILWEARENGKIVCNACYRRCLVPDGSHGFCYVRKNVGGKLYLSVYGKLAAMQIDPVEKKPFNHFSSS